MVSRQYLVEPAVVPADLRILRIVLDVFLRRTAALVSLRLYRHFGAGRDGQLRQSALCIVHLSGPDDFLVVI